MTFKSFFIIVSVALLSSCSKELTEANINPNATENAQPDYLLTSAIKTSVDAYWGTTNNMNSSLLFVQQWSKIQYTEEDRYIYSNTSFQSLWTTLYAQSITNANQLIKLAEIQSNPNYKGVALVVRSWAFSLLTDVYGDIPYRQAGDIAKYITPIYDNQKDVYIGLINDLKEAKGLLNVTGKAVGGDIIYNGNISRWIKFANSLRLRLALRIADKEPAIAQQIINEIITSSDALISDNTDIAKLTYLTSPNQNPISALFETRDDYRVSKTLVDKLFELNDPRLSVFVSKTQAATTASYVGVPNGLTTADASNLGFTKTSKPGTYFLAANAPAVLFSYGELLFDLSEAVARGYIAGNASDLYIKGIKASLQQYGIATSDIDAYVLQALVQYDPTNFKKSIGIQKWIALYGQGLEAFAEWRRLDYPILTPSVAGVLNGDIPKRFIYPGTEQSLNGKNYTLAVANQGKDVLTTKLWFDIK